MKVGERRSGGWGMGGTLLEFAVMLGVSQQTLARRDIIVCIGHGSGMLEGCSVVCCTPDESLW